ncbi:hypothetical protein SASPL_137101 [Salvia splendens]|uniref:Uncharacterized protein n=1 Tax=Salvia splendens TaxID=180675 RepID=A0A8X8WUN1_SALSN|nr:hypothetical protein SASPL_137101 [Salvia splendens]
MASSSSSILNLLAVSFLLNVCIASRATPNSLAEDAQQTQLLKYHNGALLHANLICHGSKSSAVKGKNQKFAYIWVGNSEAQCAGYCAWPFHQPIYGPQSPPLIAPNNDVGIDGMVINLSALLAGTATNPFGNGFYQGTADAPLEAATACPGVYAKGAYPGYAGDLLVEKSSGASYNAHGVNGRKYVLPAIYDPSTSKCSTLWYGVECDASGYVVSLQLDDEAISGGIGDLNICGSLTLPTINSTILSFQKVPSEVSTLTRLASLDISNEPNTTLSLELPNLKMLVQNLTGLRELYLDDVNVTSLHERKNWDRNNLSAVALDDLFTNFPSLTTLTLGLCKLKGSIPSTFASLTKLIRVDLSYNSLAGSLPSASFEGLSNLVHLNLLGNSFSGNIPQSLFALPSLLELILSYNQFNGTFQLEDFQSLPNLTWLDLRYLDLSYNALEGKITKSLELCTWLGYMNIGNNKMNDTFPCMLSSNLGVLVCAPINSMGNWKATMLLPSDGNSRGGTGFEFENSDVTLIMKGQMRELRKIWLDFSAIDLSSNSFYGKIPNAVGDLSSLHLLNFSHNAINGSIPKSFGRLSNLESLDLSVNQLAGPIPEELGWLTFLSKLNLSYNKFVGAGGKCKHSQLIHLKEIRGYVVSLST